MTIIGVTCVKNEEDIIEAFVRHNLFYLQKLIVLNHGSTDNTASILTRLIAEGLPLVIENDASLGNFQAEKMTRLMKQAVHQHGADWVLLLDADELIRCQSGQLPLPPPEECKGALKVPFRTYQVRPSDDQSVLNPAQRIQHRLAHEPREKQSLENRRYELKTIVPRALAGNPETFVTQGSHFILTANREPTYEVWAGFDYAHFSLRSVGHYASKVAICTLQSAYHSAPRASMNAFYITHLEELRTDFEKFSRHFYERLPSYLEGTPSFKPAIIHDPLYYRGGPLRYTSLASDYTRLISNLIGHAESLVRDAVEYGTSAHKAANHVEEVARLGFSGQETESSFTHTISASSNLRQTIRFDLGTQADFSTWFLHIESMAIVAELAKVRWIFDELQPELELSGKRLHTTASPIKKTYRLHHDEYASFIKGTEDAVIALKVPTAAHGHAPKAVEIQIQIEVDATSIGTRLLQNNMLDGLLSCADRVLTLERKLIKRTSFTGALGFQFYRLWRTTSGLFKIAPSARV